MVSTQVGNLDLKNDNVVDPATGLTPKHKRTIQGDWELVKTNLTQNGVDLFVKFFTDYPHTKDYFEDFKGKDVEMLKDSSKLRAHASTVMNSLSSLVDSLDDAECLVDLARKIAKNHYRRKIGMDQYKVLGPTLVELLQEKLGNNFTDYNKQAWVTMYGTFCNVAETEIQAIMAKK